MDHKESVNCFFDPDSLRSNLIFASVFIAVYENFKSAIVDNVKGFYWSGFQNGKDQFDEYEEKVLSKVSGKENRQIRATLVWYKEAGAISEEDITKFKELTDIRNSFGHDLLSRVYEGLPENIYDTYYEMIALFDRITKWWVTEIEIPTNPDITPEQYDSIQWDAIASTNLEFIKIMTDIAFTGNEKYLELIKQLEKEME